MSHPDPTKEYNEEESIKVWKEACNDGIGECKNCNFMGNLDSHNRCKECTGFLDDYESNYPNNKIDELPSIYSDDAPPHMQMRMLWNKVNEIIKKLNKQNE